MYPEFAYSREMQTLLAVQAFLTQTIVMYLTANLILTLSDEKATRRQKLLFAFWTGTILQTAVIYAVYAIGGRVSFSPLVYTLMVSPNPAAGYLYYIIGCKTLKLSPIRSIKLMSYFYTYYVIITNITQLVIALWPIETAPRYNYLQNSARLGVYLLIIMLLFAAVQFTIKKTKLRLRFSDSLFINITKERIIYLGKMVFLYAVKVTLPMVTQDSFAGSLIIMLVLAIFLALMIVFDLFTSLKNEMENKEVHISVLSKAVTEYSSARHDYNNILQTYSGYIAIGSLEGLKKYHTSVIGLATNSSSSMRLGQRMEENPGLIALLSSKTEYAEKMNVDLKISLKCSATDLYMDNLDICRCVACLLDNAIESATDSEQKKAFFTLEQKQDGSKLIIVSNNTANPVDIAKISAGGNSSKKGHHGLGLSNVRKILAKYGNCTLSMTYYDLAFSVYIELRKC